MEARDSFQDWLSDNIQNSIVNKKPHEFWDSWNTKLRKNVNKHVTIHGYTEDIRVWAAAAADHTAYQVSK